MKVLVSSVIAASCALALAGCHHAGGTAGTSGTAGAGGSAQLGPPGALSVWTTGVGRKVQPTTAPGSSTTVSVETCSDATASFQVVVRGKGGSLTQVQVALEGDLTDGNGHTLGKGGISFYRAFFIDMTGIVANSGTKPVPASSPTGDGRIPDPLIPLVDPYTGAPAGEPFDVVEETNQPIFVDFHVPKGTPAGTYTGTIRVDAAGGQSAEVPLSIVVWGLDLPDMSAVTTHFKMSINDLYDYHANIESCVNGGCYLSTSPHSLAIVKRYEELAHDHRIDTAQQLVFLPGTGGCDLPAASDWAAYDAAMGPYMDGSYWSDGVPSTRLGTIFSPGQSYGPDGSCTEQQYVALAGAWAAHLQGKGWFDKAIVDAYDEPPPGAYAGIALGSSWLQASDPGWRARVMDTHSPDAASAAVLDPALGVYAVNTFQYDDWAGAGTFYGRKDWPTLFALGIQLWIYESNAVLPPYATFATNTLDGLEPVILMWGSWYEKATGFLYWDIASWAPSDPGARRSPGARRETASSSIPATTTDRWRRPDLPPAWPSTAPCPPTGSRWCAWACKTGRSSTSPTPWGSAIRRGSRSRRCIASSAAARGAPRRAGSSGRRTRRPWPPSGAPWPRRSSRRSEPALPSPPHLDDLGRLHLPRLARHARGREPVLRERQRHAHARRQVVGEHQRHAPERLRRREVLRDEPVERQARGPVGARDGRRRGERRRAGREQAGERPREHDAGDEIAPHVGVPAEEPPRAAAGGEGEARPAVGPDRVVAQQGGESRRRGDGRRRAPCRGAWESRRAGAAARARGLRRRCCSAPSGRSGATPPRPRAGSRRSP